jgi:hypothetical protein
MAKRNQRRKTIETATEINTALPIRAAVRMPAAWAVRGFVHAVRRVRGAEDARRVANAAGQLSTARDATIALAEAATWLDLLIERFPALGSDENVLALKFVRARTHHQWASAIDFDDARSAYVWYPEANLPLPDERKFQKPKGQHRYVRLLEGHPVDEVLTRVETRVRSLVPDADLN